MVKGIREDLDKVADIPDLPLIIHTTLMMFKNNIVFNSFYSRIDIKFGNDVKRSIYNSMKNAMICYHL